MSHPLAVGDPVARPVAAHERVVALDPRREAVFAAGAAWFAWQLVKSRRRTAAASGRCLHPAPHLVECVAMLYMFFAATPLTARAATPLTRPGRAAARAGAWPRPAPFRPSPAARVPGRRPHHRGHHTGGARLAGLGRRPRRQRPDPARPAWPCSWSAT